MARLTWRSGRAAARTVVFATFLLGGLAGLVVHHGAVATALATWI